jgi:Ca-activated chloride channel homolog
VRFSDPHWLPAGVLASIVLIGMWRWYDARRQAALARFVSPHLVSRLTGSVSRVGRLLQRGLFLASILSLFAALAGPQLGYHWEQISRRGNEVVFAIDTSRSMLTPDIKPDRLTRAKLAIDDMARQLDGDGIGIVAFAGSAFLVCPLTLDYGAFQQSLDAVDVHTIPRGGTNISSAILAARAALRGRAASDRILILVTDGENLEGDALSAAQAAAREDGLKIYTIGVGTGEGELIPLPPDLGGGFVKDETGAPVKSHLDEGALRSIASATGGAYVNLQGQGENFDGFLTTVFGAVSKHDLIYRQQKIYTERYQWPLAASVVMLLASLVVGTRRLGWTAAAAHAVAASVLFLLVISPMSSKSADQTATSGSGDAKAPIVQYNRGTSAYRAGQFSAATNAFEQSIRSAPASDAKRLADQEDAYYNLGDALYRAGQQFEKSAPQEAIRTWTDAVKAYDTALQLRGDDADSKYNRDFVQRKIDALRRPPDQGGGGGGGGGSGGGGGAGAGGGSGSGGGRQGQAPPGEGRSQGPPPARERPPQAPPQNAASAPPQPVQPAGSQSSTSADADGRGAPGQMSAEEARELLDSAKSDEHHSLPVPSGPRDPNPEKSFKNW